MNAKAELSSAEQNGRGWYETIAQMVAALECDYERLNELREEADSIIEDCKDAAGNYDVQVGIDKIQAAGIAEELAELEAACTIDGDKMEDAEAVRERIQESPLSVEVRSGWYAPGGDATPEEFCILLSTGGPALRLMGDLDEHGQPTRAYLQHQDWGTPWTDCFMGAGSGDVLLTFAQQFYFGEG